MADVLIAVDAVAKLVDRKLEPLRLYSATVVSVSSGQVQIKVRNASTAGTATYARVAGVQVQAGDEVLVANRGRNPIIIGLIQRSAPATLPFEAPIKLYTGQTLTGGTGSPEGVITAPVGSLYLRTDGTSITTLYQKATGAGNTGWVAMAPSASPTFTGTITVDAHILASNNVPTITNTPVGTYPAAGTTPGAATVHGNDTYMTVTFTTGTGPAAGALCRVAFANAMSGAAFGVWYSSHGSTLSAGGLYTTSRSTSGFTVVAGTPPSASASIVFSIQVVDLP
jgi:hypothetical protein